MTKHLCVLALATIIIGQVLFASAPGESITVRDRTGSIIGYIDNERVLNKNRKLLGYVRDGRTTDAGGKLIATPEVPGLLLCKELK